MIRRPSGGLDRDLQAKLDAVPGITRQTVNSRVITLYRGEERVFRGDSFAAWKWLHELKETK